MVNLAHFFSYYVFILFHLSPTSIHSETITNPGTGQSGGIIQCKEGEDCTILCRESSTCMNAQINCPTGYKCSLTCAIANRACQQTTVNALESTRFEINDCYSGNKNTCTGMTIFFPPNIAGTPVSFLNVGNNFNGFIADMHFYAINGWRDIDTTGYTGTYQSHTGTMHCTDTYTSSCSFETSPDEWNCLDTGDLTCDTLTSQPNTAAPSTVSPTTIPTSTTLISTTVYPTSRLTSNTNHPTSITSNPTTMTPTTTTTINRLTTMTPSTTNHPITTTATTTSTDTVTSHATYDTTMYTTTTSNTTTTATTATGTDAVTSHATHDTILYTATTSNTVTVSNPSTSNPNPLQSLSTSEPLKTSNNSNATIVTTRDIASFFTTLKPTVFMSTIVSLQTTYTMDEVGTSSDFFAKFPVTFMLVINGAIACCLILIVIVLCCQKHCGKSHKKQMESVFGKQHFDPVKHPKETNEDDQDEGELSDEGMQLQTKHATNAIYEIQSNPLHQSQRNIFAYSQQNLFSYPQPPHVSLQCSSSPSYKSLQQLTVLTGTQCKSFSPQSVPSMSPQSPQSPPSVLRQSPPSICEQSPPIDIKIIYNNSNDSIEEKSGHKESSDDGSYYTHDRVDTDQTMFTKTEMEMKAEWLEDDIKLHRNNMQQISLKVINDNNGSYNDTNSEDTVNNTSDDSESTYTYDVESDNTSDRYRCDTDQNLFTQTRLKIELEVIEDIDDRDNSEEKENSISSADDIETYGEESDNAHERCDTDQNLFIKDMKTELPENDIELVVIQDCNDNQNQHGLARVDTVLSDLTDISIYGCSDVKT